jgi:hypothetical protein
MFLPRTSARIEPRRHRLFCLPVVITRCSEYSHRIERRNLMMIRLTAVARLSITHKTISVFRSVHQLFRQNGAIMTRVDVQPKRV